MCGIYGSTIGYSKDQVQAKMQRAAFRGPDATSIQFIDDKLWLGHNRLSIIDLDERSNQPFVYAGLHIVFNGEIYNYLELKATLQQQGFAFTTSSDTEVICAAYKAWGEASVEQLNGMFAFVIYDSEQNLLFGARDRLGKKPLYYSTTNNAFEFASQPAQIALYNSFDVNEAAISQMLIWQQISDPNTIYKHMFRLKAGHCFRYQLSQHTFSDWPYWDLPLLDAPSYKGTYEEAKTDLRNLLNDAVEKRMLADVPLGVFLSGGVDSSLIAAIAQQQSATPVNTFAVQFDEAGFDESPYAAAVARHLGTRHTTIQCNYAEAIELIENYHRYYDEPFADASALPSMLLARHTRKHVTVALSGDGGDESFLGYSRYDWIRTVDQLLKMPHPLRKVAASLVSMLPVRKLQQAAILLQCPNTADAYTCLMSSFAPTWLKDAAVAYPDAYKEWLQGPLPLLERVSNYDLKTYLNNDINTKVDRASMAFSLEARAPLMDYRIVEFARSLPTAFKYQPGNKKRILKDVLYELVPQQLIDRPKQGFGMPLAHWFRHQLKDLVKDELTPTALQQIPNVDVPQIQTLIDLHLSGKEDRHVLIWNLLVMVQWLKKEYR